MAVRVGGKKVNEDVARHIALCFCDEPPPRRSRRLISINLPIRTPVTAVQTRVASREEMTSPPTGPLPTTRPPERPPFPLSPLDVRAMRLSTSPTCTRTIHRDRRPVRRRVPPPA